MAEQPSESPDARLKRLTAQSDTMDIIVDHVTMGGTIIGLCEVWDVKYTGLLKWIRADENRKRAYNQACLDREEWDTERIVEELRSLGFAKITNILNADGTIKPVNEWPREILPAIETVELHEPIIGADGELKQSFKKVSLISKIQALQLHGKKLKLYVDRTENTNTLKLEDIIGASYNLNEPMPTPELPQAQQNQLPAAKPNSEDI